MSSVKAGARRRLPAGTVSSLQSGPSVPPHHPWRARTQPPRRACPPRIPATPDQVSVHAHTYCNGQVISVTTTTRLVKTIPFWPDDTLDTRTRTRLWNSNWDPEAGTIRATVTPHGPCETATHHYYKAETDHRARVDADTVLYKHTTVGIWLQCPLEGMDWEDGIEDLW